MGLIQIKHAQIKFHLFGFWTVHVYIQIHITPVNCEKIFCIVRSFITEAFLLMYV
jgi:hypothetical protein